MTTIRYPLFRRLFLAWIVLATLVVQSHTVFACTIMAGVTQNLCCCDDEGSGPCGAGGTCIDHREFNAADCCATFSQIIPILESDVPVAAQIDLLLINAPQAPPPFPTLPIAHSTFISHAVSNHVLSTTFLFAPRPAGTRTFLQTLRLRI